MAIKLVHLLKQQMSIEGQENNNKKRITESSKIYEGALIHTIQLKTCEESK